MNNELSEELKRFITAPWISKAYLAEQLFGERSKASSAKFSNKMRGIQRQRFKEDELRKLSEIRNQIIKNLIE